MTRFLRPLLLALLLAAASATPALAHVHLVSEADCAPPGVASGALVAAAAPGRPDAQIPVTASEGRTQGQATGAQGTFCDGI